MLSQFTSNPPGANNVAARAVDGHEIATGDPVQRGAREDSVDVLAAGGHAYRVDPRRVAQVVLDPRESPVEVAVRASSNGEEDGIDVDRDRSSLREPLEHPHADRRGTTREVEHLERLIGVEEHTEDVEHGVEPLRARLDDPVLLPFPALEPPSGVGLVHALSVAG